MKEKALKKSTTGNKAPRARHVKQAFAKPGNFLYPVPAAMVSCCDKDGKPNIITVAWTGTICSDPPMLSIAVRKERFSHHMIDETGEFVVNLTSRRLVKAADFCGVRSGKDVDKFEACHLTPGKSTKISAPAIEEAPVSIECRVKEKLELGSHDLFLAEVLAVQADQAYMDEKGRFHMEDADLTAYSHGSYYTLGDKLGTFGYSVRKKTKLEDKPAGSKAIGSKRAGEKKEGSKAIGSKRAGEKKEGSKAIGSKRAGEKKEGSKAAGSKGASGLKAGGRRGSQGSRKGKTESSKGSRKGKTESNKDKKIR